MYKSFLTLLIFVLSAPVFGGGTIIGNGTVALGRAGVALDFPAGWQVRQTPRDGIVVENSHEFGISPMTTSIEIHPIPRSEEPHFSRAPIVMGPSIHPVNVETFERDLACANQKIIIVIRQPFLAGTKTSVDDLIKNLRCLNR